MCLFLLLLFLGFAPWLLCEAPILRVQIRKLWSICKIRFVGVLIRATGSFLSNW